MGSEEDLNSEAEVGSGLLLLRLRLRLWLENVLESCLLEVVKRRVRESGLAVLERGRGEDRVRVGGERDSLKGSVDAGRDFRAAGMIMAGPGGIRCGVSLPWISKPGLKRRPAGIPFMPHGFSRRWLRSSGWRFFWNRAKRRFHSTRVRRRMYSSSWLLGALAGLEMLCMR